MYPPLTVQRASRGVPRDRRGIETAFCSYGADFSEADEEIYKTAIRGNVVARGGSNVTNDVTA